MISTTEATKDLTSAIKGFKLSTEEAMSVVDKLTKIDQVAAISAGNLAEGLARVATTAQQAGLSLDETAAMVTTITEVTQRDASTAGEALRTLISRYSNVKAGVFTSMSDDAEETSSNINDIEKVLSKLGIRIRTSGTEMRSIEDVLDELAEKWSTLDDVSRNAVASAFAGVRQRESFNILLSNWDRVKELTEESTNAAGTADEKYSAYMDSMEAATKRLQNAWESLSQSFETSPLIKGITNIGALFAENAIEGIGWLKQLMPLLLTLQSGSIIGAVTNPGETGGFRGLLKNIPIIGNFVKSNDAIQQIAKDVHEIKEETAGSTSKTKNEGALKKIWRSLTGRQDIVDPETGKSISYKDAAAYRKLLKSTSDGTALTDPQMNQFAKLLTKRQIGNAVFGGVSATLAQLATTKEVGSGVGGWIGKLFTGNLGNEQTVEETADDKALRTIASGGLAALGGAFFGPLGAMLGQTIGEGAASIVSTIIHRSELEMKQRVADAKENLNRLDDLRSTMGSNNSIMTETLISSEDFEKLYEYTDDLYEKLFELQYDGNVDIIGAFNHFADTVGNKTQIENISDLVDEIKNGDVDTRQMIKRQLELAEAQVNLGQLQASQEETREEAEKKIRGGYKTKYNHLVHDGGLWPETDLQKMLKKYGISYELGYKSHGFFNETVDMYNFDESMSPEEVYDKIDEAIYRLNREMPTGYKTVINALKEFKSQIKEGVNSLKNQDRELIKARSNVGFLAADIHDLTTIELQDLTMDGVVGRVVKALEAQGVEVRNTTGYIKDEYQDAIEKLIKSDSKFNALQQADTKTLGQLTAAQERFEKVTNETIKTWDEWYDRAQRGDLEEYAKELGVTAEELEKIIYAANPERIEQFARAWNTTTEGLKELTKKLPDLTTAIGLMSPSEVREYYSVFTDFFEDLAADSVLTAENFEKLINQYPQLLKYYKNGMLSTELLGKVNEEQRVAYANAILSSELSSSGMSEEFLAAIKSVSEGETNEETARFVDLTKESAAAILKEIGSIKSLNEVLDKANELRQKGYENEASALEKLVEQYLDYERAIEWTNPLYSMAQQGEIDRLTQEIENLNEQKDALSNVNDERQRELELIKAKEALENARKEKKRVFRTGLGFVLESDEEAITTAQENLDKLNIEKQQEDIQYQIEQLESLKSILENLDEEKQKEANKKALEEYFGGKNPLNLTNSEMVSKLVDGYAENRISINAATGEIKDINGNIIGKMDGLEGVKGSKGEQTEIAKRGLIGGTDADGNEIVGMFKKFEDAGDRVSAAKETYGIGSKEYREAVDDYAAAKKNLEAGLLKAENAMVDAETLERGSALLESYEEPEKADWRLVKDLRNPDGDVLDGHTAQHTHDVMLNTISPLTSKEKKDQFGKTDKTAIKVYDSATDSWSNWKKLDRDISLLPDYTIVMNNDYKDAYAWVKDGQLYWLTSKSGKVKKQYTWQNDWATGTLSSPEGLSLINELGTEAVITPGGTLTALPSKTGIVPADITRNVWALGEIAPTLVAQLSSLNQKALTGNAGNTTYEEGQYIDNLTMNVYPTKDYDMDRLLSEARAKARLTRHSN